MSTRYVSTPAGSRLPVAMAWSVDASMSATVTPGTSARMASAAATASVITSGSGPSSRSEPPSTNGISRFTHSYITPPSTKPSSTAAAIDPHHPVHRDRPRPAVVAHHEGAVHLGVLDTHPALGDANLGRQVGGGVEAGGQHPILRARLEHGVDHRHTVGPVDLERREQR